jgi:hypothetical protein
LYSIVVCAVFQGFVVIGVVFHGVRGDVEEGTDYFTRHRFKKVSHNVIRQTLTSLFKVGILQLVSNESGGEREGRGGTELISKR